MSGLLIVVLCIFAVMGLVFLVNYWATHYPHTRLGRICKAIDEWIDRLPD